LSRGCACRKSNAPASKPTDSLDTYDLYLRAPAQTYRYNEQGLGAAIALLRQALAIDPSYAPAAALLSLSHWQQATQRRGAVSDADIAEAARLARLALADARGDPETMSRATTALGQADGFRGLAFNGGSGLGLPTFADTRGSAGRCADSGPSERRQSRGMGTKRVINQDGRDVYAIADHLRV
jgi:hypothetical protein